ncbi:sulfurtransferase-like selenium metabolism protein YedF [Desulfohalobiaceae bacterium Ax17]|uniref:sulfurtransferase-like selenium metabolism protein YedF n=1 Tax=Desulfovulcanus ferrireducens TaxID=2831190 RepID=UPI00207B98AA|nr:sulfurtransferase-like selenium metabolism protein YedF [Desulfovulcanus ferrireducens]MBT8763154.1 sulfurtransferase-like selenium metabolism protein YedF [Desulfovulcanus ferrireducens]
MSEKILHCQGLPCPQPVLKCKQALEEEKPEKLIVYVDNEPAKENVTRFLNMQNYKLLATEKKGNDWLIVATCTPQEQKTDDLSEQKSKPEPKTSQGELKTLIFITKDKIGMGDDQLGHKLMVNFLATLPEMDKLWRIILVNSGVKLATDNSPVLESLQQLEQAGVSILVCGTCLDFFQLLDQKRVGQTTNMLDVVTSLQLADKVITI